MGVDGARGCRVVSLSIQDAASQLDLYAAAFDKAAAEAKGRYEEMARDPGYTVTGIQHILQQMDVADRQAHQLRFAATFLRDHVVVRWTKEKPTMTGLWWYRPLGMTLGLPVRLVIEDNQLVWHEDGYVYHVKLAGGHWAGPLVQPEEAAL